MRTRGECAGFQLLSETQARMARRSGRKYQSSVEHGAPRQPPLCGWRAELQHGAASGSQSAEVEALEGGPAALLYCPALASHDLTRRLPWDSGASHSSWVGSNLSLLDPTQPIFGYFTLLLLLHYLRLHHLRFSTSSSSSIPPSTSPSPFLSSLPPPFPLPLPSLSPLNKQAFASKSHK